MIPQPNKYLTYITTRTPAASPRVTVAPPRTLRPELLEHLSDSTLSVMLLDMAALTRGPASQARTDARAMRTVLTNVIEARIATWNGEAA